MRTKRLAILLATVAIAGALAFGQKLAARGPAPAASGPVAILATPAQADAIQSDVRLVDVGTMGTGVVSARERWRTVVPHARGAVVRGDVLPEGAGVVLVLDEQDPRGARDLDWSAALHRVDGAGTRVLARDLCHASRPLVSVDGGVYVERGVPGAWPTREEASAGRLRTDALTLERIDPDTGAARAVASFRGYALHIAGELGSELLVYRVAFEGADLVAVERASGRVRVVTPLLPFARDFSVDRGRGALLLSNRDERDSRAWVVDRIDVATGARERLVTQRDEAPVPYLAPNGDARWSTTATASTPDAPWIASLAAPGERLEPIAGGLR